MMRDERGRGVGGGGVRGGKCDGSGEVKGCYVEGWVMEREEGDGEEEVGELNEGGSEGGNRYRWGVEEVEEERWEVGQCAYSL